jgi:hypothetical protein
MARIRDIEDYSDIDPLDERGILRDGHRLRVPMTARDSGTVRGQIAASRQRVHDSTGDPWGLCRPGFRYTSDSAAYDAKEKARDEMVADLTSAWKRGTRYDEQQPPLGAFRKGLGLNAGDRCMVNGRGGRLVERDGWLWCKPTEIGPTRRDAIPHTMDAEQAQKIRDQAYQDYCNELADAWRHR